MTFVDSTGHVDRSLDLIPVRDAAELHGVSLTTLNRYIANGSLPAFKIRGRNHVTRGDLIAALGPIPVFPSNGDATNDGLRAWAERAAAAAPPLRPEQRKVLLSAFSAALQPNKKSA